MALRMLNNLEFLVTTSWFVSLQELRPLSVKVNHTWGQLKCNGKGSKMIVMNMITLVFCLIEQVKTRAGIHVH